MDKFIDTSVGAILAAFWFGARGKKMNRSRLVNSFFTLMVISGFVLTLWGLTLVTEDIERVQQTYVVAVGWIQPF